MEENREMTGRQGAWKGLDVKAHGKDGTSRCMERTGRQGAATKVDGCGSNRGCWWNDIKRFKDRE